MVQAEWDAMTEMRWHKIWKDQCEPAGIAWSAICRPRMTPPTMNSAGSPRRCKLSNSVPSRSRPR